MFSRKQLIKLILPLVVEQFLAMTIGIADTLMVATCGEAAVSGISLVDSINILLINIFSALATGGAIVCSQYIGKEQPENARKAAKQLVLITAILSVAIMIACLLSQRGLLRVLFGSIEDAVMNNAVTYLFLSALSYPFIAVYNAGAALFRSMGNSKISMYASLMMNIVNVGGNALLIFQFNMGVAGAGLASLISRILAAVFVLYLLRSKKNLIRIENWLHWKPNFGMIKNILRIGIPTGLENGMFQIGKILVASLIASFGTASITANAVANSASSLVFVPAQAIGLGMITVVGQCVGAGNFKQARRYMLSLTGVAYLFMTSLNILMYFCINPMLALYQLSAETATITREIMVWHCIAAAILWPAAFTLPNGLRAAGDVKFTMIVSVFSMWTFRIGFSFLIGKYMGVGVLGVWIAMFIDWIFRIILFVWRVASGKWKNRQLV